MTRYARTQHFGGGALYPRMRWTIRFGVAALVAVAVSTIGWRARATVPCSPTVSYTLEVETIVIDGNTVASPGRAYRIDAVAQGAGQVVRATTYDPDAVDQTRTSILVGAP